MKTKQLLLLILVLVAGILVLERTGTLGGGTEPGAEPEIPTGSATAPGDDPALAALGTGEGAGPRNRTVLGESKLPGGLIAAAPAGPGRTVKVIVDWPDAARPKGDVEACIFQDDIGGGTMLRALTTDFVRPTTLGRAFDGLNNPDTEPSAVRERALAVAPLTANNLGRWTATLEIPQSAGRVFAHVVGATYYTPRAGIIDADMNAVTVRPRRGGELRLKATTQSADLPVEGIPFTVSEDKSLSKQAAAQNTEIKSFRLDGTLDANGEALLRTVPAGIPIQVTVYPESSALATVEVPAINAGTAGTAVVKLVKGGQMTGYVVDPSGVLVPGAVVTASIPGRAFGIDDDVIRKVTTADDGTFALAGLPGGELIVRASAKGWLQTGRARFAVADGVVLPDLELALTPGNTITGKVLLDDGSPAVGAEVLATFDLGHMMGPAALAITRGSEGSAIVAEDGQFELAGLGRGPFAVTCDWETPSGRRYTARQNNVPAESPPIALTLTKPVLLSGTVVDTAERPLTGLEVHCIRLLDGSIGTVRIDRQRRTTDDEGRFQFEVDQDRFELSVREDEFVTLERLVVNVGDRTSGLKLTCAEAVTAKGIVLDPDGSPVKDAVVSLETRTSSIQTQAGVGERPPMTRTAKDGTFALVGIQPGEVILNAEAKKLARVSSDAVTAAPGDLIDGVILRLNPGGTIEGICFDDDGRTAAGRIVSVTSLTKNISRNALSDADGTFRIEGLTPGSYQVMAMDPDMEASADVGGSPLAEMLKYMKLASAVVVEGETALVFLGAPPSDPVDVEGRVTQGGQPFAGGLMVWLPATKAMDERMVTAEIDKDGRYTARLNQSGQYVVNIRTDSGSGVQQETVEFPLTIPDATKKLVKDFVVPGGGVAGLVTHVDGSPAVGVRVAVTGVGGIPTNRLFGGSYAEIKTDTEGRYRALGLRPGSYQVSAGGGMFLGESESAQARVTVGPFSIQKDLIKEDVNLQLVEPGVVQISVTDGSGAGVLGASVFLLDEKGRHSEMFSVQTTGQGGILRMNTVAPGTYTLASRTGTLASQESLPVTVVAGETSNVELTLGPGILVHAFATVEGNPISNATIQIFDSEGRDLTRRAGMVDINAINTEIAFSFESRVFGPFPPGNYVVKATEPGGKSGSRRLRLKESKPKHKVTVKLK